MQALLTDKEHFAGRLQLNVGAGQTATIHLRLSDLAPAKGESKT
jgi:hypothetical protein